MDTSDQAAMAEFYEQRIHSRAMRTISERNHDRLTKRIALIAEMIDSQDKLVEIQYNHKELLLTVARLQKSETDFMDADHELDADGLKTVGSDRRVPDMDTRAGKLLRVGAMEHDALRMAKRWYDTRDEVVRLRKAQSSLIAEQAAEGRMLVFWGERVSKLEERLMKQQQVENPGRKEKVEEEKVGEKKVVEEKAEETSQQHRSHRTHNQMSYLLRKAEERRQRKREQRKQEESIAAEERRLNGFKEMEEIEKRSVMEAEAFDRDWNKPLDTDLPVEEQKGKKHLGEEQLNQEQMGKEKM